MSIKRGIERDRQRGWAGIVVLLVAVLIVAFLSKDALLKYLGPATTVKRPGTAAGTSEAAGEAAAPAPATALERAQGLQNMLQKESEKRGEPLR